MKSRKFLVFIVTALFFLPVLLNAVDETEPNDAWDAAGVLLVENGVHNGNITPGTDVDYWAFEASLGDFIEVTTIGLTTIDTQLWLYGTSGTNELAYNDDSGGTLQSYVSHTATEDGTYYFKVGTFSTGTGAYGVQLSGATPPVHFDDDLAARFITGNVTPTVGIESVYAITIRNPGNLAQAGAEYTVTLFREGDFEIGTVPGVDIDPGEQLEVNIPWTPTGSGLTFLYAVVNFADDDFLDNNVTPNFEVNVQAEGTIVVTIGTGTGLLNIPIDFFWRSSLSETIYYPTEIGQGGVILQLEYFYSHADDVPVLPYRIFMGHTNLNHLTVGWIPATELDLVFDGNLDFQQGINSMLIMLDTPFGYNGVDNLVIMVERPMDTQYYNSADDFYYTDDFNNPNRTREYHSDSAANDPYNPSYPGSLLNAFPNTALYLSGDPLGGLEGYVYGNDRDPIPGAFVEVLETPFATHTNANGYYSLPYVFVGERDIQASKFGYYNGIETTTIIEGQTVQQDITLDHLPTVNVSGHVITSDTGANVADAAVTLEGYDNYATTTDANGMFTIPGVYASQTYLLTIVYAGYETYENPNVVVGTTDLDLGDIIVNEIAIPVYQIVAEEDHDGNAMIVWTDPSGTFPQYEISYDDGTPENATAWYDEGNENALRFTPAGYPCTIETGLLHIYDGSWPAGNILQPFQAKIYDDDGPGGFPGTELAVVDVTPTAYNWVELDFSSEYVTITEGDFYIAQVQGGNYPNCCPTGIDETQPLVYRSYSAWFTGGQSWAEAGYNDFMFRAIVRGPQGRQMITETNEYIDLGYDNEISKGAVSVNKVTPPTGVQMVGSANPMNTRVLETYELHRLLDGDQGNPGNWTEIATGITDTFYVDTSWQTVPAGVYRYAVTAVYTNGVMADPGFSNIIEKSMYTEVTVDISTDAGDDPAGATVVLTNQDGDANHIYTMVAPTGGMTYFPEVYLGVYDLSVSLPNYNTYNQTDINIFDVTTIPVTLNEIILAPVNPTVEEIGDIDRLSWMEPGSGGWFEGFEGTFPPGGWSLLSPDGGTGWDQIAVGTTPLPGWTGGVAEAAPDGGSYMAFATWDTGGPSSNDQWLITDQFLVTGGLHLNFYMVCWYATSYDDHVEIRASTTVNSNTAAFDIVIDEIDFGVGSSEEWELYDYVLSDYITPGQMVYIGFRETVADNYNDGAFVALDNVSAGYPGRYEIPEKTGMVFKGDKAQNSTIRDFKFADLYYNDLIDNNNRVLTGYNVYLDNMSTPYGNTTNLYYDFVGLATGMHTFGVSAVYSSGNESDIVTVDYSVEADANIIPVVTQLNGNYPNPFNPVTGISFSLAVADQVVIEIYNIRGEKVRTLVNEYMEPNFYTLTWNGSDDNGRGVTSGVYFYKMKAGRYTSTKKMLLMK